MARALADFGRVLEPSDITRLRTEAQQEHSDQLKNPELRPKDENGKTLAPESVPQIVMKKLPKAGRGIEQNKAARFERISRLLNDAYQAPPAARSEILVKARGAITQNPTDNTLSLAPHIKAEAQSAIEAEDSDSPEAKELLALNNALAAVQWQDAFGPNRQQEPAYAL